MERRSCQNGRLEMSSSSDGNVTFSEIESVAKDWIIDFSFFSVCHHFKEAKHEEFESSLQTLEAFLEGSVQLKCGQRRKIEISCFLGRIVNGKQDVRYESDDRVTPLMSAVTIWSSLEDAVLDRALFENIRNLLFVQSIAVCMETGNYVKAPWILEWLSEECAMPPNLKMKLSLIVNQKDTYHKFLENFSFNRLVENISMFLDQFLDKHHSDFLVRAASKVVTSLQEKTTSQTTLSESESGSCVLQDERNADISSPVILKIRPKKTLFSTQNISPWKCDPEKKNPWTIANKLYKTKATARTSNNRSTISQFGTSMKTSKRKFWTYEEDQKLKAGVKCHGKGRWTKILQDFDLKDRTSVMLKDRWRTLQKLGVVD